LQQKPWIVPIPVQRKLHRPARKYRRSGNRAKCRMTLKKLMKLFQRIEVQGARYSAQAQKMIDR
jgi:hypothetical protein